MDPEDLAFFMSQGGMKGFRGGDDDDDDDDEDDDDDGEFFCFMIKQSSFFFVITVCACLCVRVYCVSIRKCASSLQSPFLFHACAITRTHTHIHIHTRPSTHTTTHTHTHTLSLSLFRNVRNVPRRDASHLDGWRDGWWL